LSHLSLAAFVPFTITIYLHYKSIINDTEQVLAENKNMYFGFLDLTENLVSNLDHACAIFGALLVGVYLPICLLMVLAVRNVVI
jgi:hypothetical protein